MPAEDFRNANAWFSSTYELASISGPAAAGFLIALAGGAWLAFAFACAAHLGFVHPVTGRALQFDAPLPADLAALIETLRNER